MRTQNILKLVLVLVVLLSLSVEARQISEEEIKRNL